MKWWFIVKRSNCDNDLLEKEWASVTLQTGWKLEPLLRIEDVATSGAVHSQQPPNHNTQNIQPPSDDDSTPIPTSPAQPKPPLLLLILIQAHLMQTQTLLPNLTLPL